MKIQANILGRDVHRSENEEVGAFGAIAMILEHSGLKRWPNPNCNNPDLVFFTERYRQQL